VLSRLIPHGKFQEALPPTIIMTEALCRRFAANRVRARALGAIDDEWFVYWAESRDRLEDLLSSLGEHGPLDIVDDSNA
jgi:hypothetical protein